MPPRSRLPALDALEPARSSSRSRSASASGAGAAARPLRLYGVGTLFVTHTLGVPAHPAAGTSTRAHTVARTRGGNIPNTLRVLAQLPGADAHLVAPLGGGPEGAAVRREVEDEGVRTARCRVWPDAGVPCSFVLDAGACLVPVGRAKQRDGVERRVVKTTHRRPS
jgi:hypothetical protein